MIQAGLYLRMSKDAEARGLGIARQRKDAEALAERLGWPIVREYSDNDLSASKYSPKPRPDFLQMVQDLQEGAINAVVVYDQDRLVRQPKELLATLQFDAGDQPAAEDSRDGALQLGKAAGHQEIMAWSFELLAWSHWSTSNPARPSTWPNKA